MVVLASVWLFPAMLTAQVTIFPEVNRKSGNDPVQIMKVELTKNYTIVSFYFTPRREGAWICVDKNFYVTPAGLDDRHYMIMARDVEICPRMTKVTSADNDLVFTLWFPPLPESVFNMDIIESPTGMRFYNVHINNNGGRPYPENTDSVPPLDVLQKLALLDPERDSLSGVWKRDIKRRHISGQDVILGEYKDVPDTVMIVKTEENFRIYTIDGKSLGETITPLTGDLGYFYKLPIPQVESTGSAYLEWSGPDEFGVTFLLPVRLARYLFPGEYLDSDYLYEIQEYRRLDHEAISELIEKLQSAGQAASDTTNATQHDQN